MGKYLPRYNLNDELIQTKEELLLYIVNELAERNRLKRLEMVCARDSKGELIYDKDEVRFTDDDC